MPLSRSEVEHVARLAHLGLRPDEIGELTNELSSVLDHVAQLRTVDTTDVPPTAHVALVENVMREDEVRPSWAPAAVLSNAPHRADDLFQVQAIFD